MIRKQAIEIILKYTKKFPIISANGFPSRDLFESFDKESNFYMIGSMGLASSIGMGIAIKNPKKRIIVFDGDGNLLMNLGSITTIGSFQQKNLIHIVFDNSAHESTGGQPTNTNKINIGKIAKASKYTVFTINNKIELEKVLEKIRTVSGPIMLMIKIEKSNYVSKRIKWTPIQIKNRFMNSLNN